MVRRSSGRPRLTQDAAETNMARRGVHRLGMTRGRAVAAAVIRRTEVRAALQHLTRNHDFGLAGVVARFLTTAPRIRWDVAGLVSVGFVSRRVPFAGPFPHVADHVVDAVAVRRECCYRGCAIVSVKLEVLVWKRALPGVCHLLAARREFIAPGELGAVD